MITLVLYGNSDSRYLREVFILIVSLTVFLVLFLKNYLASVKILVFQAGTQSIGFSPMNNTPMLIHGNDEYLNKNVFLRGIEIYEGIISSVANV